jgi:hypothetical protein
VPYLLLRYFNIQPYRGVALLRAHLVVPIQIPARILAQNLHNVPPTLNLDAQAYLAALWIVEPRLEFVRRHIHLVVEEYDNFCIGFSRTRRGWVSKKRGDGYILTVAFEFWGCIPTEADSKALSLSSP